MYLAEYMYSCKVNSDEINERAARKKRSEEIEEAAKEEMTITR